MSQDESFEISNFFVKVCSTLVAGLQSRQKDFDGQLVVSISFAKDSLQLFFCQSKKEKLQKKVAFLGFVEVMPQAKWLAICAKAGEVEGRKV